MIFPHDMHEAVRGERDAVRDAFPSCAEVTGPVDVRIEIGELVQIHGKVGGRGVVSGRLDVGDRAPGWEVRDVPGEVLPVSAAVPGQVHLSVVAPCPDQPALERGLGDREQGGPVVGHQVVDGHAAGTLLVRLVVGGEVRRDHLPGVAPVRGTVDVLAADVHGVVIVRRDVDRERPVPAKPEVRRRPPVGGLGPHAHRAHLPGAMVVPLQAPVVATRPHDVAVGRIGDAEAALAAPHAMPEPQRDRPCAAVRRSTVGPPVLAISVDVVRDLVVRPDVVHLGDRQHHPLECAAPVHGNREAAVVGDHDSLVVGRVDPHIVRVATAPRGVLHEAAPSVHRHREAHGGEVDPVLVLGVHPEAGVGEPAADARQPLPAVPAVLRTPDAAVGPAAVQPPGVDLHVPEGGEEDAGVARIHREVDAAGVLRDVEDPLPAVAAIGGAIDAPLRLRTVGVAQSAGEDDVGVPRVDLDASDASGGFKSLLFPRVATIGRAVDPRRPWRGPGG